MHRQNIEVFASTVFLSFYADICYIQIDNIFSPLRKYKELMLCIGKITYTEEGPMDKKKVDFKSLVADKGKAATDLFDKTKKAVVQSIDQNEDGKFDLSDITVLTDQWNERKEQQRKESDRKRLCPIFEEDLDSPDFLMTKLIRVCEMDKKHAESDICQGSIGFESVYKDLRVINIYLDKAAAFGLSYYPDIDSELYYVNPCVRDQYIALDEYFYFLKVARVSELQKIAQDLGAKHFRVTFKEQKKSLASTSAIGKLGTKVSGAQNANVDFSYESKNSDFSKVEIAAEMECIGHKPVEPTLVYFKKDPQIQNLVSLRMSDNAMTHQVYTLALSNSSGIKMKDALKIDAALSAMKCAGNTTVTSEVQSESRRYFEYEIDF